MQQVFFFKQFQLQTGGNSEEHRGCRSWDSAAGMRGWRKKSHPSGGGWLAPAAVVCHPLPFLTYTHIPRNHMGEQKATYTEQHHLGKDATQIVPTKLKIFNV